MISLSTCYLTVQDDDTFSESDNLDVSYREEPTSNSLFRIPMICATNEVQIIKEGFFKHTRTLVLTINSCTQNIGIDLLFEAGKNEQEHSIWLKYAEEAKEKSRNQINRVLEAKLTIRPMFPKFVRHRYSRSTPVLTDDKMYL